MSEAIVTARGSDDAGIDLRNLIWVALALVVLAFTIAIGNQWALNFLHVMCGVMWTGIDLFMGFVVGPIIRRLPFEARRAVVVRLMPKTLFLMPDVGRRYRYCGIFPRARCGVSRRSLAGLRLGAGGAGDRDYSYRTGPRRAAAGEPDGVFGNAQARARPSRIGGLMQRYVYAVAFQGVMQVAIIVVMAKFVTGL